MARNPEIVTVDPDLGSRAETKRAVQLAHFTVVGEAGYGVEAVTVAKEHTPDVFLVSFEEPVALGAPDDRVAGGRGARRADDRLLVAGGRAVGAPRDGRRRARLHRSSRSSRKT